MSARVLLTALLWAALPGCAIGGGALSGAGQGTTARDEDSSDKTTVRFGASVGAMPTYVITTPEGGRPGDGLGWALHAGAQLYVNGLGGSLEYQLRQHPMTYAGGFDGGSRAHALMGFVSWAPLGFLSLELGGGALVAGHFGWLGGCGDFLDECTTTELVGAASGVRGAARLNLMLFSASPFGVEKFRFHFVDVYGKWQQGEGRSVTLPLATSLRFEFGYQHLWVQGAPPLPPSVGSFSFGLELMLGFF